MDEGLYLAGVCLQGYFLFIVLREMVITATHFAKGERNSVRSVLTTHFYLAFLDILILGSFSLWALPCCGSRSAEDDVGILEPVSEQAETFMKVTLVNTVLAFGYIAAHCCSLPLLY